MVAGGLEAGDYLAEGGHGLGAVAAAVVLEDDRAGPGIAHDVGDDRGHAGAGPVAGVDGPGERGHAGARAVAQDGRGPGAVGGAEEGGEPSGHVVDLGGRPVDLVGDGGQGQQGQVEVGPGVIGDQMAGGGHLAGHAGVGLDLDADHGERRGHLVLRQQSQHLRGVDGVRAVVDGQRDGLGAAGDAVHRQVAAGGAAGVIGPGQVGRGRRPCRTACGVACRVACGVACRVAAAGAGGGAGGWGPRGSRVRGGVGGGAGSRAGRARGSGRVDHVRRPRAEQREAPGGQQHPPGHAPARTVRRCLLRPHRCLPIRLARYAYHI
jgi:hypothetical protein